MGFLNKLFNGNKRQPEEYYIVSLSNDLIKVEHPENETQTIRWDDIDEIKLSNNDSGPWGIDIWMVLVGKNSHCQIPHGSKGFDEIYEIVSKYKNFNFNNLMESMSCTENKEFLLWSKE